jgi:hypothetical protein
MRMVLERDPVVVGTGVDHLTLSNFTTLESGTPYSVDVAVQVEGLSARITMFSNFDDTFDDLVQFFAGMARDWRGWKGSRNYESLEHDLKIQATNNGHVLLHIGLRSWMNEWAADASLALDAGEELSQGALDVAHFLRRP